MTHTNNNEYDDEEHTNVFVKFLPSDIDDCKLRLLFTSCGFILSAKVMINQSNGESLGYGFVRFSKAEEAKKAVEVMAGHRIGSKTLLCKLADTYSFPEPSCNLYIKPLPLGADEDTLRELFSKYGHILTVKIVDVRIAESVVGFVKYDNVESATLAIESLNGSKIFPGFPSLLVKYAESDVQRAVRKANNHQARKQSSNNINNIINNDNNETQTISIQTSTIQITSDFSFNNNINNINNLSSELPCELESINNSIININNNDMMECEASINNNFNNNTSNNFNNINNNINSSYYGFQYVYVPVCVPLPCSSYMQPFYSPSPSFYYTK